MEVNLLSAVQSSYVISSSKTDTKAVEDTEFSETEKLEAFKKEIWDEINSMPRYKLQQQMAEEKYYQNREIASAAYEANVLVEEWRRLLRRIIRTGSREMRLIQAF